MSTLKEMLFASWDFMRWLRLALGVFIAVQAIQMHDTLSGIIAFFFLAQAITNTGCCGTTCTSPNKNSLKNEEITDVSYEEIKN